MIELVSLLAQNGTWTLAKCGYMGPPLEFIAEMPGGETGLTRPIETSQVFHFYASVPAFLHFIL